MIYPLCFKSPAQFREWAGLAVKAREEATPCSDCTKEYKARMLKSGNCNEQDVQEAFKHVPKSKVGKA